jgi:hypothetical protein
MYGVRAIAIAPHITDTKFSSMIQGDPGSKISPEFVAQTILDVAGNKYRADHISVWKDSVLEKSLKFDLMENKQVEVGGNIAYSTPVLDLQQDDPVSDSLELFGRPLIYLQSEMQKKVL